MKRESRSVCAILWNPGNTEITAGGFSRAKEILIRFKPEDGVLHIIDAAPSIFKDPLPAHIHLHTYKIPAWLKGLEKKFYNLERILEWLYSMGAILNRAIALRSSYDTVYAPFSELIVLSIPGALIKMLLGKRVVLCNLNTDSSSVTRVINNWAHGYVDRYSTTSRQLARDLKAQGMKGEVVVNFTGVDIPALKKAPSQPIKFDAIFIGRHAETKGIFDYVKMLPQLVETYPEFKFASVGHCPPPIKEELIKQLREVGLEKRWQFIGVVSDKDKLKYLKQARTLWFLSSLEGWGMVPQEALGCGVLPLCYDLPVYKENIRDCPAATFVPIGDWNQAAKEAIKLLKMPPKKRTELEKIGQQWIEPFGWDEVAKREIDIIYGEEKPL